MQNFKHKFPIQIRFKDIDKMGHILKLISKGYTRLILVAFVIGAPFSYWLMQQWLQDFAYRITPSIWIFALTGLSVLVVAVLITSYYAVKAALTNPVGVLRDG